MERNLDEVTANFKLKLRPLGDQLRQSGDQLRQSGDQLRQSGDQLRQSGDQLRQSGDQLHQSGDQLQQSVDQLHQSVDLLQQSGDQLQQSGDLLQLSDDGFNEQTSIQMLPPMLEPKMEDFESERKMKAEEKPVADILRDSGLTGTKLKCPFCERTYGFEQKLRSHIRQRHQGIRVPCPFCHRSFTRNNIVRKHIAREHRHQMTPQSSALPKSCPTPPPGTSQQTPRATSDDH